MVQQSPEYVSTTERCMIDGSWTHDTLFNGCGWTWKNSKEVIQLLEEKSMQKNLTPTFGT